MEDIIIKIALGLITPVIQFIITKILNPKQPKPEIVEIRKQTILKKNKINKGKPRIKPTHPPPRQKNKYLFTK
jgi:hypothetical protein